MTPTESGLLLDITRNPSSIEIPRTAFFTTELSMFSIFLQSSIMLSRQILKSFSWIFCDKEFQTSCRIISPCILGGNCGKNYHLGFKVGNFYSDSTFVYFYYHFWNFSKIRNTALRVIWFSSLKKCVWSFAYISQ